MSTLTPSSSGRGGDTWEAGRYHSEFWFFLPVLIEFFFLPRCEIEHVSISVMILIIGYFMFMFFHYGHQKFFLFEISCTLLTAIISSLLLIYIFNNFILHSFSDLYMYPWDYSWIGLELRVHFDISIEHAYQSPFLYLSL